MKREEANDLAWRILVVTMPAFWLERPNKGRMMIQTAKAIRLRDQIARALLDAYKAGKEEAKP